MPGGAGRGRGSRLYRTTVRLGLNELRGSRRGRETRAGAGRARRGRIRSRHGRRQVREVMAAPDARQAALLAPRSEGLSYEEVSAALELNPASVGTFLSRAQQAFRKEYVGRYGPQR